MVNRCVARSDTCGTHHHKSRRPRRRSNRYQPRFRYPFDLFKVVPFFRRIPAGGAFCTTQRLAVVGQLRRPSAYVRVPFPTRADTPVRPYNTSTHPGNIPHINVGADRCPKIRNRSFVAPKPRYGCPQAGISAPTNGHMDAYAGTIHQCRASAPCCFSGICRTGSYVRHRKFYNRHRKNYVRPRKFYVRHRKRAVSTPPGRTVKPFHNDNRCVARSDTCGIHPPHKSRRPRRRSNRSQPRFRYPFDLFKVVPSFVAFPQVAHSAPHSG